MSEALARSVLDTCYVDRQARHLGAERIYTFDGRFPSREIRVEGMR